MITEHSTGSSPLSTRALCVCVCVCVCVGSALSCIHWSTHHRERQQGSGYQPERRACRPLESTAKPSVDKDPMTTAMIKEPMTTAMMQMSKDSAPEAYGHRHMQATGTERRRKIRWRQEMCP